MTIIVFICSRNCIGCIKLYIIINYYYYVIKIMYEKYCS